ncbi:MAG: helix-hairpin-helix domain-containing protein [Bacteroidaceae bacterium]|nr:helix-hairpin-helix domain-containing protein [Bacteroidaceae bacterium]
MDAEQVNGSLASLPLRHATILLVCFLCATTSLAQSYSWEDFADEMAVDEELAENEEWQYQLLELKELHDKPLNINTATIEDLCQLPFLSEEQIEQIHAYIYLHGEMKTLGELMLVPLLDADTRKKLRLFVRAEPVPKKEENFWGRVKHDLSTRLDIPLYYRKGFLVEKNGYRGDALGHRLRYTLNTKHLKANIQLKKDAGERYYDSHGGFASLKDIKAIDLIVLGDYRIGMGEGLVLGTGTWNVKNAPATRPQSGLRPMTSLSENDFLRGAAASLRLGKQWKLLVFASHQQLDATLTPQGEVKTFITSGYHRTDTELEKRHNTRATTVGGDVTWKKRHAYVGVTGYYETFSRTLNPGSEVYRRIYPIGTHFGVAGIHYGYKYRNLTMAGETAYSTNRNGVATLNRIQYAFSSLHSAGILQRYYSDNYHSFHSSAMGENSKVQNENGVLVYWRGETWSGLQMMAYADFFFMRWPPYGMTHSNQGQELMGQVNYTLSRHHSLTLSYRWKNKERYDKPDPHHRLKAQWTFTPTEQWKCTVHGALHHTTEGTGLGIQAGVQQALEQPSLRWSCSMAYAHTPSYDARLYFYEPSLYNSVSSVSLYGRCLRGVAAIRWSCWKKRLTLEARYALLRYLDRDRQSDDLQTIYSPWKNDIQLQVRMQL